MAKRTSKKLPRRSRRASHRLSSGARVVIVADTHSRPHPEAHRLVAEQQPELILHAGDIGDLSVIEDLETIAPVVSVRGNIDARGSFVPDDVHLELSWGDERLDVFLTHIALSGVRLRADVARAAKAVGASLVVCGHSHIPFLARDRGLQVFNPGSIGPRRFRLPIVFGVLEPGPRLSHVSCETGEPWLPVAV